MDRVELLTTTDFGIRYAKFKRKQVNKHGPLDFDESLRIREELKGSSEFIKVKTVDYRATLESDREERDFLLDIIAELLSERK